ncbi:MAG TPA: 23S rRNA (pseudouridine(1915)-N(3))-methyltransferase RlmH [Pyrinomonadaceae bacterium]|nr:23S rRNA (pseudouridine(1915)-N(3))-methyltransferase RlmH [Pyrinomonadaceae bacterium]
MKFRFIWIGKTKDKNWKALQEEYLRRLSHFVKCEITEIKESAPHEGPEIEGKRILEMLNPKSFAVILDVGGKAVSSHQLSAEITRWQDSSVKEVTFIIGGADGVSQAIREKADYLLSLSFLTFTHDMARVVLLEQLYRGYSIIKGFPYQK